MSITHFTKEQLHDFARYEYVRLSGDFNMWAPQAQACTGLDKERYFFVIQNYCALKAQFEQEEDDNIKALADCLYEA